MVEAEGMHKEGNRLADVITWESSEHPLSSSSSDPQRPRPNRWCERQGHPLEIFSNLSLFWRPTKLKAESDKHLKAGPHFDFKELTYSHVPHPVEETFSHAWAFGCPMCGPTSKAKPVLLSISLSASSCLFPRSPQSFSQKAYSYPVNLLLSANHLHWSHKSWIP